MKRCPACKIDYFDEMLEFCLEDGARLVSVSNPAGEMPTVTKSKQQNSIINETVNFPLSDTPNTNPANFHQTQKAQPTFSAEKKITNFEGDKDDSANYKVLEIAPIVVSLAHNWWQWVYLNNQYYSSFTSYVFSANFLMWLLLLIASATLGILSLRFSRNRAFAYTGLVILAINLILFLVPKR